MGAMKSLAWDYALLLQRKAMEQDDLDFDVDETFVKIVNNEIEIPEEYVEMWVRSNSVFASEDVVFDAETNSWKQQNRDSKGRFIKGFSDKTDAQLIEELEEKEEERRAYIDHANDEYIYNEMIAPYYQYVDLDADTPVDIAAWLENAVLDDNFPERLSDRYYYQYLQKIVESVPYSKLEVLHDIMEMQMNLGQHSGDRDIEILGGRGVFITDILMNLKQGQETWAAETKGWMGLNLAGGVDEIAEMLNLKKKKDTKAAEEDSCDLCESVSIWTDYDVEGDGKYIGNIHRCNPCYQQKGSPYQLQRNMRNVRRAEDDEDEYTEAEINLMRYDLVEHELENVDYNYLYDVLLYGTTGWANLEDAEVVQQFRNIFER
jgi:hypothetical protein